MKIVDKDQLAQAGLSGIAHVIKELEDLSRECHRQAVILSMNHKFVADNQATKKPAAVPPWAELAAQGKPKRAKAS